MTAEWDQRLLCPDGGCIGVIGGDGTCKVCGRAAPNWGDERRRGKRTTAEVEPEEPEAEAAPAPPAARTPGGDDEFEQRQLCPDGGCIGVIGDDGRCRVCGRRADQAPDDDPDDPDDDEYEDDEDAAYDDDDDDDDAARDEDAPDQERKR